MVEGDVPLLRSKAHERQRLSGGGVVPFGVGGERNGECDHPVADSLLKARRKVIPEAVQECQHSFSALLRQGGDIFLCCFHFENLYFMLFIFSICLNPFRLIYLRLKNFYKYIYKLITIINFAMKNKYLRLLAFTFFASGIWDTIAGILYIFFIGTGRQIDNPPIDPFFAIFLGSFFICFAYLQFLSSFNIKRYAFNVGCLIIGRLFYIIQLYIFMIFAEGFPSTFWFTGVIDGTFTILYIFFAIKSGLGLRDLFLPKRAAVNL